MSDVPPPPPVSPGSGSTPGGPVDVGQAVGYSWRKFQQYAGPLLTIVAVVVVVNLVGALIRANTSSRFLGLILVIVFWVVGQIVNIGVINASLMVTRGETPEVGKAFSTDRLGDYIVGSILYGLAVFVGFIFCILPGIALALLLGLYGYFVLDQNMSGSDALKASFDLVKSNAGTVIVVLIVAFVLNMIGLAMCGIGLLVTAPVSQIMLAYVYRSLTGQSIAP